MYPSSAKNSASHPLRITITGRRRHEATGGIADKMKIMNSSSLSLTTNRTGNCVERRTARTGINWSGEPKWR